MCDVRDLTGSDSQLETFKIMTLISESLDLPVCKIFCRLWRVCVCNTFIFIVKILSYETCVICASYLSTKQHLLLHFSILLLVLHIGTSDLMGFPAVYVLKLII